MSHSEKMWCWMPDSYTIMTTYLKRWTMHENWDKSFFCPMDKKMISPHIEWCFEKILVCAKFSLKLAHGT